MNCRQELAAMPEVSVFETPQAGSRGRMDRYRDLASYQFGNQSCGDG